MYGVTLDRTFKKEKKKNGWYNQSPLRQVDTGQTEVLCIRSFQTLRFDRS